MARTRSNFPLLRPAVAMLSVLVSLPGANSAWGQSGPAYTELYQDPPRTDQLTPADLPNLGRQVVLEATSMYVHARRELSDSPEAFRLLEQIQALWNQADAFTAAVAWGGSPSQAFEAGAVTFPDLEGAFERVRATLGVLPGSAPRAATNLQAISRAMAVMGPLLRQGVAETASADISAASLRARDLATIRAEAWNIARAVQAVRRALGAGKSNGDSSTMDRELDTLFQLCVGLIRLAVPAIDDRDVVSSMRPLRSQAQRIDLEARSRRMPAPLMGPWTSIKTRIDALASRFQIPHEIVLRRTQERPARSEGDTSAVDAALTAVDEYLKRGPAASSNVSPAMAAIDAGARRLQSRLYLLRQMVLGRERPESITRAQLDVISVRRQLEARANAEPAGRREALDGLLQAVDRVIDVRGEPASPSR